MKAKRKRQAHGCSLPLVGLYIVIFILTISFYFSIDLQNHLSQSEVDSDVVISFPEILEMLNSDWESRGVRQVQPYEDLKGRPRSLVMRTDEELLNVNNTGAFISYSVMTYTDALSARERYDIQNEVIFFQFNSPLQDTHLVDSSTPNKDVGHSKCRQGMLQDGTKNTRCTTILLYGRYIVYVNMFTQRNDIEYVDDEMMTDIFAIIDDTMKEILAESG